MPYDLTSEQREKYRATSIRSQQRKQALLGCDRSEQTPLLDLTGRLDVNDLMPQRPDNGLRTLSLFSGGGGLDLGFERAGYKHAASVEILDVCGDTLRRNRPGWQVLSGVDAGDVTQIDFKLFRGVEVVHGGPPCQPFSTAGKQAGASDPRNMWPEFVRCVLEVAPRAFIAENVPGLLGAKFAEFVTTQIVEPLHERYEIFKFVLSAHDFGVPQARKRVFFVGFRNKLDAKRFIAPMPTHGDTQTLFGVTLPRNTARASLGLSDSTFDTVAPTLRSGFTGPRKTTGVINSKASEKIWQALEIWPNGVQPNRALASAYTAENGHFRMAVEDCALLQGFPADWHFSGAVYQVLGQIGNSVCPPVAYSVARSVANALER
jgi:DNA (cytosine-5)-methyltransferase 1